MEQLKLSSIHILPNSENPEFEQRESGISHTSYYEETVFFSFVERGNCEAVGKYLSSFLSKGLVIGHLSDNHIRQIQYWAVCCVTLGIRYAIQGGLDEMTAFNLSDKYIMQIDSFASGEAIVEFLSRAVMELTELVKENSRVNCPESVRKCLNYIDKHLHEQIRLEDLAELSGLSGDCISRKFKKYLGVNIRDYILNKRLESAKEMLKTGADSNMVGYYLGFCSQTYFISRFKAAYGITPYKYAKQYV